MKRRLVRAFNIEMFTVQARGPEANVAGLPARSRAVRLSRAGHRVSPFVSSRHAVARSLEFPGAAPFEHRFSLSQRGGSSRGRRRAGSGGSLFSGRLVAAVRPCRVAVITSSCATLLAPLQNKDGY
jgi:hypothetical protein